MATILHTLEVQALTWALASSLLARARTPAQLRVTVSELGQACGVQTSSQLEVCLSVDSNCVFGS